MGRIINECKDAGRSAYSEKEVTDKILSYASEFLKNGVSGEKRYRRTPFQTLSMPVFVFSYESAEMLNIDRSSEYYSADDCISYCSISESGTSVYYSKETNSAAEDEVLLLIILEDVNGLFIKEA